jgi:CBS domain-containing protein
MKVKEIMSPKLQWADANMPIEQAARKMREFDIGCLPVREQGNGKLIGMVTDRDIACRAVAMGRVLATTKVRDVMSTGSASCFADQDVSDAVHLMEEKQLHRLAVLDSKNKLVGMLSLADVALHSSHEISGEIIEAISRHVPAKAEQSTLP